MAKLITCIVKNPRNDWHKQIEEVGGATWKVSQDQAIQEIERGERFEAGLIGRTVGVVIAEHNGNKYLKTEADSYIENNLLSLPNC